MRDVNANVLRQTDEKITSNNHTINDVYCIYALRCFHLAFDTVFIFLTEKKCQKKKNTKKFFLMSQKEKTNREKETPRKKSD